MAAEERAEWIPKLLIGVAQVVELLQSFPEAGVSLAADERLMLRQLRLRRYPYVVWYAYLGERPIADLWLVRLFGAHQDRPEPDPAAWSHGRQAAPGPERAR